MRITSLLLCLMFAPSAMAQQAAIFTAPCLETKELIASLGKDYHEEVIGGGLTKRDDLLCVFVSPQMTFTIVLTSPNGMSCMISSGTNWTQEKPQVNGTKS